MARSGRVRGRQGHSRSTLRAAIRFHTWASGFTAQSAEPLPWVERRGNPVPRSRGCAHCGQVEPSAQLKAGRSAHGDDRGRSRRAPAHHHARRAGRDRKTSSGPFRRLTVPFFVTGVPDLLPRTGPEVGRIYPYSRVPVRQSGRAGVTNRVWGSYLMDAPIRRAEGLSLEKGLP